MYLVAGGTVLAVPVPTISCTREYLAVPCFPDTIVETPEPDLHLTRAPNLLLLNFVSIDIEIVPLEFSSAIDTFCIKIICYI